MFTPRWFPPNQLPRYPHLSVDDSMIIDTFLISPPINLSQICYDVPIGEGRPSLESMPENLVSNWKYLTSLKIDAIFDFLTYYIVVEIKPELDLKTIGQVLTYEFLLRKSNFLNKPFSMGWIGYEGNPDIITFARSKSIILYFI